MLTVHMNPQSSLNLQDWGSYHTSEQVFLIEQIVKVKALQRQNVIITNNAI